MGLALEVQWPFAAKKGITMENTGLCPHIKGKRGRLTWQSDSAVQNRQDIISRSQFFHESLNLQKGEQSGSGYVLFDL